MALWHDRVVPVRFTPRAEQQAFDLPKQQRRHVAELIRQLDARGCAALDYRLSGTLPLSHLCVKHIGRNLRAVVSFVSSTDIWVLLVAPHDDGDPGVDVYTELYRLVGGPTPTGLARTKPSCCGSDGSASVLGDLAEDLVMRATRLRRTRHR